MHRRRWIIFGRGAAMWAGILATSGGCGQQVDPLVEARVGTGGETATSDSGDTGGDASDDASDDADWPSWVIDFGIEDAQSCQCATPPQDPDEVLGGSGTSGGAGTGDDVPGAETGSAAMEASDPRELSAASPTLEEGGGGPECPGDTEYPYYCYPVYGTSEILANWLWCHRDAGGGFGAALVCLLGDHVVPNGVTNAELTEIKNLCGMETTVSKKAECVGRECDRRIGGIKKETEGGCKVHAACVDDVLDIMDIHHAFDQSPTHMWNEVYIDTNHDGHDDVTLIVDSMNGIYLHCIGTVL